MKKVIIDTNFILTCVKQKIDFFEDLYLQGFKVIIPEQVKRELLNLSESEKFARYNEAKTALKILEKSDYETVSLDEEYVDKGLINFLKDNPNVVVATLDEEIKNSVKNRKMVIRGKKKIDLV